MAPQLIDLDEVDFITIGTIGPPGKRVFYLQAAQEETLLSLKIEKEHALALAVSITQALNQLGAEEDEVAEPVSMVLIEPVQPRFAVGRLGLGYDRDRDMLVIAAHELTESEEEVGAVARLWATQSQMAALARQATRVVAAGRPICQLCGEPIDPEGHTCVRGNGRKRLFRTDDG